MEKNRTAAYRRHKRYAVIRRKKNIIRDSWHGEWHYDHEGSLDKGKIHCSCPMCRQKSYDQASRADIRIADRMLEQLAETDIRHSRAETVLHNRVKRTRSIQAWRRPDIRIA
jgi:hypothetical protein